MTKLHCWNCGAGPIDEPMPLAREARCRACGSDLHVCRQCRFYDTSKGKSCAEPVADEVRDKERANFCGYFELNAAAHVGSDAADAAKRDLEALFGLPEGDASDDAPSADALEQRRKDEADKARDELSRLFGLDDE